MTHPRSALLLVLILVLPWALHAQAIVSSGSGYGDLPRLEYGAAYNYFHANAPPGKCGCFMMNGGNAIVVYNLTPKWSAVADLTIGHATNVAGSFQNITIFDYLFGPRYTRRSSSRFVPYAQAMLGGAKEDVNFTFTINRNAFAVLAGGGVTTQLNPRIGLTLGEVDWIYSRIPNAVNNRQNNLRVVTGVTFNFSHSNY
jgi:outer membrane immunogenic protein